MRKNRGNRPGFGTGEDSPGKDELCHHLVDAELRAHLGRQDIDGFFNAQFFQKGMEEEVAEIEFRRGGESARAVFFRESSGAFLVFAFYKLFIVSDGIRHLIGNEVFQISKGLDAFRTGLFFPYPSICHTSVNRCLFFMIQP